MPAYEISVVRRRRPVKAPGHYRIATTSYKRALHRSAGPLMLVHGDIVQGEVKMPERLRHRYPQFVVCVERGMLWFNHRVGSPQVGWVDGTDFRSRFWLQEHLQQ